MTLSETWWSILRLAPRSLRKRAPRAFKKIAVLTAYPRAVLRRPVAAGRYLLLDREISNFTYDIANTEELPSFLSVVLGVEMARIKAYISELENDEPLRDELNLRLHARRDRNRIARYGRRFAWYAVTRSQKPALVIESGVYDGLGSSVLLQALERNSLEGCPGRLIGIDVDTNAGWLIPERFSNMLTRIFDDSISALRHLVADNTIDLFIHDSDHRYEHESAEYRLIMSALSRHGILLSDNARTCTALKDFSHQKGRPFSYWGEKSKRHFYPGAGVGISVPPDGPDLSGCKV